MTPLFFYHFFNSTKNITTYANVKLNFIIKTYGNPFTYGSWLKNLRQKISISHIKKVNFQEKMQNNLKFNLNRVTTIKKKPLMNDSKSKKKISLKNSSCDSINKNKSKILDFISIERRKRNYSHEANSKKISMENINKKRRVRKNIMTFENIKIKNSQMELDNLYLKKINTNERQVNNIIDIFVSQYKITSESYERRESSKIILRSSSSCSNQNEKII